MNSGAKMPATLIAGLADYAASIHIAQVPEPVRRQATLCILDTLGCIVSGELADGWQEIVAVERAHSGRMEATVIGGDIKLSIEAAVHVNAYPGDIFELNDLIGGHASTGVVSPARIAEYLARFDQLAESRDWQTLVDSFDQGLIA